MKVQAKAGRPPRHELAVRLERPLERLVEEEAQRWWDKKLLRQPGGVGYRQKSKSAVIREAIRFFFAGRAAEGTIGEQLGQVREEAGLTVSELSRRTAEVGKPLAPSVIWRIENAKDRSPRLSSLQTLAAALEVSIVIDPDGAAVVRRFQ